MSKMQIGWSEVNITPDKKISLAGQFAERISEYVEKPLMVTALAVESGDEQMVIVGCDLPSIPGSLTAGVRELLEGNQKGLDPAKVMISAIHTHTGYAPSREKSRITGWKQLLVESLKPGQKYIEKANISNNPEISTPEENYKIASEGIAKAAIQAWETRKPGSFANAFERAVVGMCRRVDYNDGTAQMWGNANTACFTEVEGGNDSGVELLYIFDEAGELTGVVVNIACPAQCVQHRLFVSPDYWGEAKKLIREYFKKDIFVLPLCSAAGDQCPVDLVRWVNPDTDVNDPNLIRNDPPVRKADPSMFDLAGMKKAGKRVARAVIDAWEDGVGTPQEDVKFVHHVHNMQLPIRRCTLTEYNESVKAVQDFVRNKDGDIDYNDVAHLQKYLGIIQRYELQERMETLDTEVHVIRLGSVAIATNPFELFLDYGNQIRARAFPEQTFLIQLCCGAEGYLPTEKAEKHGHYSAFIASGKVGHEGGDLLVRETLKDINSMFEGDYKTYHW
ncbi:MAG: hypothetical protein IK088_05340 [Lachnospiraceae bacterium]|nr:hypothetical protein [Lachnospiraceae bacterium]